MEINRLFWGSRRGMLELDLILQPFLEKVYPSLELSDQQCYWKLLEAEDQEMYAWLMGRETPEDEQLQRIVHVIRANTGIPKR